MRETKWYPVFAGTLRTGLATLVLLAPSVPCRAQDLAVDLTSPAEDAVVEMEELVRGTVSDPGLRPFVLVHPMNTDLWWVQRRPEAPNRDGTWAVVCNFGAEREGPGEYFQVVAVITDVQLREGQTLRELPEARAQSDIVTVRRAT